MDKCFTRVLAKSTRWKGNLTLLGKRAISLVMLGFIIFFLLIAPVRSAQGQTNSFPTPSAIREANLDSIFIFAPQGDETASPLSRLFASQPEAVITQSDWYWRLAVVALRFLTAALLAALVAFRPRKNLPILQRNPFVAQTQILIAVVGAAMMMVVADSVARAFGIFAAASIVRFRTNIRDPKEITVLLICLAIGLAAGVGGLEIAVTLTLFLLLTLWVLERLEQAQVTRALELKIKTRNVERTNNILQKIFAKHRLSAELRKLDREDEQNPLGKILYFISAPPALSTDQLSNEIFSADRDEIDSVEWEQKRSGAYLYR